MDRKKEFIFVSPQAVLKGSHGPAYTSGTLDYVLKYSQFSVVIYTIRTDDDDQTIRVMDGLEIRSFSPGWTNPFVKGWGPRWLTSLSHNIKLFIFSSRFQKFIRKSIDLERVSVVHIADLEPLSSWRLVKWIRSHAKGRGPIVGFTCHNPSFSHLGMSIKSFYKTLTRSVMKNMVSKVDFVFTHGEWSKSAFGVQLGLDAKDLNKVHSTPYGSEPVAEVRPTKAESWAKLQLEPFENATVLLFFGGVRKDKNPLLFLQIIAAMPITYGFMAGKCSDFPLSEILAVAASLGISDRLHVIDKFIEEEDIKYIFASTDLVIATHSHPTVNSGPVQMARSYGIPVVGPDTGEIGSYIRTYQVGYVVADLTVGEYCKAIDRYRKLSAMDLNSSLSRICTVSKQLTWSNMAKYWLNCYQQAIDTL